MRPGKIIFWLLTLLAMLAAMSVYRITKPRREVARLKSGLERQGISLDIEKARPVTPPGNNGPELLKLLMEPPRSRRLTNTPVPMMMTGAGRARVATRADELKSEEVQWEHLEAELKNRLPGLKQATELASSGPLDFSPAYENSWDTPLPHLNKLISLMNQMSAACMSSIRQGRKEEAVKYWEGAVMLPVSFSNEVFFISQTIRARLVEKVFALTWECIHATNWSEQELSRIQGRWELLNLTNNLRQTIQMETAAAIAYYEKPKKEQRSTSPFFENPTAAFARTAQRFAFNVYLRWLEELEALRFAAASLEGPLSYARLRELQENGEQINLTGHGYFGVDWINNILHGQTYKALAVAALRAHRIKNLSGAFPETLDDLPTDGFVDKAVVYKGIGTNFHLYGTGVNRSDDGGDPMGSEKDIKKGKDVVWPRPETN